MRNFRVFVRESLFPRTKAEGGDDLAPLVIVGEADAHTKFEAIVRHNAVGSWTMTIPAGHPQSRMLTPGRGIVVFQEGVAEPLFSGPIRQLKKIWGSQDAGAGTVEVTGVDDNCLMAERLAWTNPKADIHLASAFRYWKMNPIWPNVAEVLRNLFLENTQGQPMRRLERLFIPGPESTADLLGDDTSRSAQIMFDQPDQLVAMLSAVYGFRIRFIWHPNPAEVASNGDPNATGPGILLKLEPIANRTNEVRFGTEFGNLRGYSYMTKAPEATRLVIGTKNRTWTETVKQPTFGDNGLGDGYTFTTKERSGPERWFGYYTNHMYDPDWWGDPYETPDDLQHTLAWANAGFSAAETEWGVTAERYKDKRDIPWMWTQVPGKPEGWAEDPPPWTSQYRLLQDEVEAFNLESGPVASITIDPLETNNVMFGRDYGLGDLIRVIVDGEVRDEVVREARLSSTVEAGPLVQPTIGTFGSTETPYLYAAIRALWDRVHGVETREGPEPLEDLPDITCSIRKMVYT
ncbi:virus ReqiPepy6 Gp37-like protein [Streptosporangium canum]|uniref:Virus ReqiPepy6 Gp37-like protein n=1 Tax=Streptosporangium canum TaxID=324952 RepID=A0A1I3LAA6_9ACTN|nr:hypothetical protein [Streptosporangium canum]SFI81667.1 virus ReqiPepy6 Gp37-like protein [Streptosporangium canum]